MNSHYGTRLILLPTYVKKIGIAMILIWISIIISILVFKIKLPEAQGHLMKEFFYTPIILGLALIGISKDKIEDEFTIYIRLRAILWSFFSITLFIVFTPFIRLMDGKETVYKAENVVLMMLIGYLLMYYYQKFKR
jgi:hypothetical protein